MTLERVQNKYDSHLLKIDCPPHNYSPVFRNFNIVTLADRRGIANLNFLIKLLHGQIKSTSSLSLISFKVPARSTRLYVPFNLSLSDTNYVLNEPLRRWMALATLTSPLIFLMCVYDYFLFAKVGASLICILFIT